MKASSLDDSASWHDDFVLNGSDGDQPAGRVMALALAAQLGDVITFTSGSTLDPAGRAGDLHSYRLALRRIKTLLIAAGSVFPTHLADAALSTVSTELRRTAGLRNLDVVATSLARSSGRIGSALSGGLDKITAEVEARRDAGYRDVASMLDDPGHAKLIADLRVLGTVYRLGGEEPGPDVLVSARKVARASFADTWAEVESAASRAVDSPDVEDWHRLRRRLKRAAFLLDAFGPLLIDPPDSRDRDASQIQAAILVKVNKQVIKLLRDLGELQDMSAETDLMLELGRSLGTKAAMTAGAIVNPVQLEIPRQLRRSKKRWKKLHQLARI